MLKICKKKYFLNSILVCKLLSPLAARTMYGTIWGTGYTIARHERDTTEKLMCHVL